MNLIFDLDRQILVQKPGSQTGISKESIVRGDEQIATIKFVRGTLPALLPGTLLSMVFVAKRSFAPGEASVLLANAFVYNAVSGFWSSQITQNSDALRDIIASATETRLIGELTFKTSLIGQTSSQVFNIRVTNDLWRSGEVMPPIPDPDIYINSRTIRYDIAQNLTPEQRALVYSNIGGVPSAPLIRTTAPVNSQANGSPHSINVFTASGGVVSSVSTLIPYSNTSSGFPIYSGSLGSIQRVSGSWVLTIGNANNATWTSTSSELNPVNVPSGRWNAITNPNGWKPAGATLLDTVLTQSTTLPSAIGQYARVGTTAPYSWYRADTITPSVTWAKVDQGVDEAIVALASRLFNVPNATARKLPSTYAPSPRVGVDRVMQADSPFSLWILSAADVTLESSWIRTPLLDANGNLLISGMYPVTLTVEGAVNDIPGNGELVFREESGGFTTLVKGNGVTVGKDLPDLSRPPNLVAVDSPPYVRGGENWKLWGDLQFEEGAYVDFEEGGSLQLL